MKPIGEWILGLTMAVGASFVFSECSSSGSTPDAGSPAQTSGSSGSGGSNLSDSDYDTDGSVRRSGRNGCGGDLRCGR